MEFSPLDVPLLRWGTCGVISAIGCLISMVWVLAYLVTALICSLFMFNNPLITEPAYIIMTCVVAVIGIGCGVFAIFKKNKINVPKYFLLQRDYQENLSKKIKNKRIKFPVVIKPVNEGSSLGVYICKNKKQLKIKLKKL